MGRFWFNFFGKKVVNNIVRGRRFQGASNAEIFAELKSGKWLRFDKEQLDYAKTILGVK